MHYSFDELENTLNAYLQNGDLEAALREISGFVLEVINRPYGTGVVFSCRRLDELCQKIGQLSLNRSPRSKAEAGPIQDLVVYVASDLMTAGGHSAVLKDLIALQPAKQHVILITNLFETPDPAAIHAHFAHLPVKLYWAPSAGYSEKLQWLQKELVSLRPGRTYLFNHHHDSIAIAALQPGIVKELLFYHHADHQLCLGVHLEHALHIDPHPFGYFNCKEKLQIKNNIYWPLVTQDRPYRTTEAEFLKTGGVRTGTSGNSMKFEAPYAYSYIDLLPQMLQKTGGSHVHIGTLSEKALANIQLGLKALQIPQERFRYIPWVASLWQAMLEENIDLYINSFPRTGLKATIEVLGSGTPIVFHENYSSQLLGGHFAGYPEAFIWRQPQELLSHLSKINGKQLIEESRLARACYEQHYQPKWLAEELAKPIKDIKGMRPPPLPPFEANNLQMGLDTMREYDRFEQQVLSSTSWRITAPLRNLKLRFQDWRKWLAQS